MKKKERSRFFSKLDKLVRDQTGSALVEGTVLMPVLFILILGVFDFSYVFFQQQLIETAVPDPAPYLSRTTPTGNPCDAANVVRVGGLTLTATAAAQNVATHGSVDPTTPARVCTGGNCWLPASVNITCVPSTDPGSYLLP